MNIPINKDFEHDYRETVYKGFTLHEAKYVLAGLVLIVSVCLFLWRYIGISPVLAVYISVPVGAPIMIAGFWQSKNGLTLREHLAAEGYSAASLPGGGISSSDRRGESRKSTKMQKLQETKETAPEICQGLSKTAEKRKERSK